MSPPLFALLSRTVATEFVEAGSTPTQAVLGLAGLVGKLDEALHDLPSDQDTQLHEAVGHKAQPYLRLQRLCHFISLAAFRTSEYITTSGDGIGGPLLALGILFLVVLALFLCMRLYFVTSSSSAAGKSQQSYQRRTALGNDGLAVSQPASPFPSPQNVQSPTPSFEGYLPSPPQSDVFCPALVVDQPGGVGFTLKGPILPHQQDGVVEVVSSDEEQGLVTRVIMQESGLDSGILVESAVRYPVAWIDTANAVAAKGERPPTRRSVAISCASTATEYRGVDATAEVYATAQVEGGQVVIRRGRVDGSPLYWIPPLSSAPSLSPQGVGAQRLRIIDAGGNEVARSQAIQGDSLTLWVAAGMDAGMLLCAIIAERKLR